MYIYIYPCVFPQLFLDMYARGHVQLWRGLQNNSRTNCGVISRRSWNHVLLEGIFGGVVLYNSPAQSHLAGPSGARLWPQGAVKSGIPKLSQRTFLVLLLLSCSLLQHWVRP